ncbi:tRNA (guanine-N(7)-)-methyltransferase [Spirochaetia bacterium]|nr:tRNA (guanine-N(7)-)-methyltransferase [Spirochaetia bacterium]
MRKIPDTETVIETAPPKSRRIRSYVLRVGRMSDAQRRSYEELFPCYGLSLSEGEQCAGPLDCKQLFSSDKPLTIEIGFGMGIATAQIAEEHPENNYLGIEVHRPGIGRLLWEIKKRGLENIRIIEHDAVTVLEKHIPDGAAAAFHVFFPDPWPKKRHHKRRLMTRPFTDLLAQKLTSGGYVYMVTDWVEYGEWALAELSATPGLINPYGGVTGDFAGGFAPRQSWRPETKFERKGLDKHHELRELYFEASKHG